jgi:hypothetical protein
MKDYKLQYPDLIQPKDKDHILYKLLEEYIIDGDQKSIAIQFDINESVVSDVKHCKSRSRRVFDRLISIMMKRRSEQERIVAHMTTPLSKKAA